MMPGEGFARPLDKKQVIAWYLALDSDPRFRNFADRIEINEYADLLVNAASRLQVVVQKCLAADLEQQLGGRAMTEMPVKVKR